MIALAGIHELTTCPNCGCLIDEHASCATECGCPYIW
jgi:hypothetical protein